MGKYYHPALQDLIVLAVECLIVLGGYTSKSPALPLSPGRGGARAGAAGVRDVCGPESSMRHVCVRLALFHNIEG